jgi:hypothetical protein
MDLKAAGTKRKI